MIKVSTTGMAVSLKTDLRFPISGQWGHGDRIIHLAIIMIIFGIFGLSTLPFLSIIVQYIDSITGFSSGNGYLTNNMDYLFKSPLIYIGGFFVFSIILAIIYLVYSFFKAKRG